MSKAITRTKWEESDYTFLKENYEILSYQEMADKLGKTRSAIQNKIKILGLKKPDKYYYDRHFFDNIDNEEKAYWLGFFYADGYVTKGKNGAEVSIELQSSDIGHLKKLNKSLKGNVSPSIRIRQSDYLKHPIEIASIRFYSNDLFNGLIKNGCVERKTLVIRLPNLQENLIWHFLRGYFDGDGCVVLNTGRDCMRFDYCSASFGMLNDIREFLYKQGIHSYIKKENIERKSSFHANVDSYRLYIGGMKNAYSFWERMYKNASVYLDRKFNKSVEIIKKYNIVDRINKNK